MLDLIKAYFKAIENAGDETLGILLFLLAVVVGMVMLMLTVALLLMAPVMVVPVMGLVLYFMYTVAKKERDK